MAAVTVLELRLYLLLVLCSLATDHILEVKIPYLEKSIHSVTLIHQRSAKHQMPNTKHQHPNTINSQPKTINHSPSLPTYIPFHIPFSDNGHSRHRTAFSSGFLRGHTQNRGYRAYQQNPRKDVLLKYF